MTTDDILAAFDRFKQQIDDAYVVVRDQLEQFDFEGAQKTLSKITQTHARTSLSLRNVLIKRGLIKGEQP